MKGQACQFCGDPVTSKHGTTCNHCKNYPEDRGRKMIDLWDKFNFKRAA